MPSWTEAQPCPRGSSGRDSSSPARDPEHGPSNPLEASRYAFALRRSIAWLRFVATESLSTARAAPDHGRWLEAAAVRTAPAADSPGRTTTAAALAASTNT